jgi:hypothetical protein
MHKTLLAAFVTLSFVGVTPRAACAQLEVLSPSVIERAASPGASYVSTILLRNSSRASQAVRIYQEDYRFYADGRSVFTPAGSHARSNASWISLPSSQVVLQAGETYELAASVAVPNDSQRVGSYWSLVLIEPVVAAATSGIDAKAPNGTSSIVTRVRQAIQLVTHIAETGKHDVRIGEPRLTSDAAGKREVRVLIENTGERAYRPQVSLEILAADGRTVFTHKQERGLIYPGTSIDQLFDLTSLKGGEYALLLVVDTGSADMFGARYRLRLQ